MSDFSLRQCSARKLAFAVLPVLLTLAFPKGMAAGSSSSSSSPTVPHSPISSSSSSTATTTESPKKYGRISKYEYILTPEQIESFHRDGCITLPNVLTEEEVREIEIVFDRFLNREIRVPGRDFCDMSKPYDVPFEDWSIVNCMLPTTYHPPFQNNVYERLTSSTARQLFPPELDMKKDYDQLLNKRPGKRDAVFAWHQDMAYWPGPKALGGVTETSTCTFSLAVDDSDEGNGCLRYIVGSGQTKTLRGHKPLGKSRDDAHALTVDIDPQTDVVKLAPASRGSITVHDEYVVHGSGGNRDPKRQRRTYVVAYRPRKVVEAERMIGFTHSHNDVVNWDTFQDDEAHRIKKSEGDRTEL